jgi:hypothetical protein
MKEQIKYPITVYSVDETHSYGADKRGAISSIVFESEPDNSKNHHFDSLYHRINGDYFYECYSYYDGMTETKYYLNPNKAKARAKELTEKALAAARECVEKLEKQLKDIGGFGG